MHVRSSRSSWRMAALAAALTVALVVTIPGGSAQASSDDDSPITLTCEPIEGFVVCRLISDREF